MKLHKDYHLSATTILLLLGFARPGYISFLGNRVEKTVKLYMTGSLYRILDTFQSLKIHYYNIKMINIYAL
jgi:hypothetical protein